MVIAGLTGGLACGKSFVARALGEMGCHIVEADELGRQVTEPGGEAYDSVIAAFGKEIVGQDGRIDRSRLAGVVFASPPDLERLNAIVHPAVRARARKLFQDIGAHDPHAVVIYVAAILIESGAYREMNRIIVVTCPREQQIERAMQRPGAVQSTVLARLDRQLPTEKKRGWADFLIDTGGTKEDTLRQTGIVYERLKEDELRNLSV
jgi:dephospho-CoA kinase